MKASIKYVIERILFIFLTLFIILSATYMLLQLMPLETGAAKPEQLLSFWDYQVRCGYYYEVDPADAANGAHYDQLVSLTIGGTTTNFYYAKYSVWHCYIVWLSGIFTRWDWGVSTNLEPNRSALEIIMTRLPYSMRINLIASLISIPVGIGFGVLAALKKNTWVDTFISTLIMVFISVPSFVLISFLLIWLAYGTHWLPNVWPSDAQAAASPSLAIKAYVIPVASLCFGSIAGFARYTRAELTEVMSSEFLLLARTKGLTRGQSIVRHALRNSMVPIIPMVISEFISILSGSMILEQLYGIPGIGDMFVNALTMRDWPVVMADMGIYTTIGLAATLIIDLSYGIVDPRIRMGARK